MKKRMKNLYFWIGLIGVILTAVGVDAETLITWEAVWNAVCDLVKNPYLLGCAAAAIIGVVVDPSTEGLKDRK